jgi:hypothetical protein
MDGALEGALDVLGVDVGSEAVVHHRDHLVEGIGLLGADIVDAGGFPVGGELSGAGDVRDVGDFSATGAYQVSIPSVMITTTVTYTSLSPSVRN